MKTVEDIIREERVRLGNAIQLKDNPHIRGILQQIEEKGFFTAGLIEDKHRVVPFDLILHFQTELDERDIYHDHNCFELAYVYRGSCINRRPGYAVSMHEGDLLLMNPRAIHCMYTDSTDDIVFNFLIPEHTLEQFFSGTRSEDPITDFCLGYLNNMSTGPDFLIVSGEKIWGIHQLIERMIIEYHEKLPGYDILLQTSLQQVFVLMARRLSHPLQTFPLDETSQLVRDVILFISKNMATVTLDDLSRTFSYHGKHISRQMKKELGLNFTEFLQQQRLSSAAELLARTNMPVAQISREVGYRNVHFFYDLFRSQYGSTPAAWRETHKVSSKIAD